MTDTQRRSNWRGRGESGMKTNGRDYFKEERVTCDRKVLISKK